MTDCPKCGAPAAPGAIECDRCGVIFAKFARREAAAAPDASREMDAVHGPVTHPLAVPDRQPQDVILALVRPGVLLGLAVWTWQFARLPMGVAVLDSVLHLPNLVFHEAGHVLLGIFGRFAGVLGGSLFQFALPLILAGVFLKQRDQ